ncbi:polyamine ABC transporter substrate-binding protein [Agromyces archimandritae]|uniref:polyamine ABC transporter substrate-binding protein n=1 Tax=Agromyces archimandritae TaxID=2781962 RepID=UPI001FD614BC|nr:spermidine/putrescine ABC transporter substrate-binding protein [Agromyces archimandritae]
MRSPWGAGRPVRVLAGESAAERIGRDLSRRRFLGMAAVAGATGLLAACTPSGRGPSPAPSGTDRRIAGGLSIGTWGAYDAPEVLESFTQTFGPAVTLDSYGSNEEMLAKLDAGAAYDLVVPTSTYLPPMIARGRLRRLDRDRIPNLANVDAAYRGMPWDPDDEFSVCKAWGTTGFLYDTTVIRRELSTWADFLDAAQREASGATTMLDAKEDVAGAYFWANGIDWMTTDEAELAAAEDFLVNTLAPHLQGFDSAPSEARIPDATSALVQDWNGDARFGILASDEPERWRWVLGAPRTELWMDCWAIPADAANPDAAHAFIDWVLEPPHSLAELEFTGYHTGTAGVERAARDAGVELPEMIFFSPEQLETMDEGELTAAQPRLVEILDAAKARVGA